MPRRNRKLRDGIMKRGATWSYVIRVKDTGTGVSKPRWVGGYATEEEAKAARDEARVKARRGEYIDRNRITVAAYLDDWIDSHATANCSPAEAGMASRWPSPPSPTCTPYCGRRSETP